MRPFARILRQKAPKTPNQASLFTTLSAVRASSFDQAIASTSSPSEVDGALFTRTAPPPPPSLTPSEDELLLQTLSRLIMKSGKLARAHKHIDTCLSSIALSTSSPPLPVLNRALGIVSPSIRIVGRRKGTKSLPTPQPLTEDQRIRQAWKWIVEASEKRLANEKIFGKRLAAEVLAVLGGQSEAIKKKEARHQQGVTGRANVGR
ncbi:ribosomal protein S7 [Meredithblackwellia eburnea MCA 4105]